MNLEQLRERNDMPLAGARVKTAQGEGVIVGYRADWCVMVYVVRLGWVEEYPLETVEYIPDAALAAAALKLHNAETKLARMNDAIKALVKSWDTVDRWPEQFGEEISLHDAIAKLEDLANE